MQCAACKSSRIERRGWHSLLRAPELWCGDCGALLSRRGSVLRKLEQSSKLVLALLGKRPIYSQLVVTRRCNLSCGYCSEYDGNSPPVPLSELKLRIDALERLGAFHICLLGGEPLLHPDLCQIVEYGSRCAQLSITTNGFLLTPELIIELNDAGLFSMQVSIDALEPDARLYIQKSLKTMRPKLALLRQLAAFRVFINIVLCEKNKHTFRRIVDEVKGLGLPLTVGLVHDDTGRVAVRGAEFAALYDYYQQRAGRGAIGYAYNARLLRDETPRWQCKAGARYIYVDEHGRVQLCPTQPRRIDKPVVDYQKSDLLANYASEKGCESGCVMMCGYRPSAIDNEPLTLLREALYPRKAAPEHGAKQRSRAL